MTNTDVSRKAMGMGCDRDRDRDRSRSRVVGWRLALALALLLSACNGSNRPAPLASHRGYSGSPAPTSVTESAGAPASEPSSSDRSAMEAEADERPGLGTVFGETRRSPVRDTAFVRAQNAPATKLALFYNDARGVRAQLSSAGGGERLSPPVLSGPGGVQVALLDASGRRLTTYGARGQVYVEGEVGQRYAISVRNPTPARLEVVASVDGLDVIDGKPATLHKRGYVLDPGESMVIDGFRLSMADVAAFRFGAVKDSYAARTAGDRHVGIIGVALFEEQGAKWTWRELKRRQTADPFPGERGFAQPPR